MIKSIKTKIVGMIISVGFVILATAAIPAKNTRTKSGKYYLRLDLEKNKSNLERNLMNLFQNIFMAIPIE